MVVNTCNLSYKGDRDQEVSEPGVGPCLCDLASGLVTKLQGTQAKVSEPDVQKNNSA
jgi:hypothetical protein